MNRIAMGMVFTLAASTLGAQTDTVYRQRSASAKSGGAAVAMSFVIPGLGQAYADEPELGAVFAVLSFGGAIVGAYNLQNVKTCNSAGLFCTTEARSAGVGIGGIAVATFSWIASMVEAPGAVRRYNEKHAARVGLRLLPGIRSTALAISISQ